MRSPVVALGQNEYTASRYCLSFNANVHFSSYLNRSQRLRDDLDLDGVHTRNACAILSNLEHNYW